MKPQLLTVSLKPPVSKAAIRAAANGNVSRWANALFAKALAESGPQARPRWTRWLKEKGRPLTQADIDRYCDVE